MKFAWMTSVEETQLNNARYLIQNGKAYNATMLEHVLLKRSENFRENQQWKLRSFESTKFNTKTLQW